MRLAARLPPADIIQLPAGGYLVVRKHGSRGASLCGSINASTQLAARQLRRAESDLLAGPAWQPAQGAPAGWGAAQERRRQRQLGPLLRPAARSGPAPGCPAPAPHVPAGRPVPVPPCKAGQELRPASAVSLEGNFEPGECSGSGAGARSSMGGFPRWCSPSRKVAAVKPHLRAVMAPRWTRCPTCHPAALHPLRRRCRQPRGVTAHGPPAGQLNARQIFGIPYRNAVLQGMC